MIIRFDQIRPGGTSTGGSNQARNDIWNGRQIQCIGSGAATWQWEILDRSNGPAITLAGAATATATFTPALTRAGTIRIKVTGDGISVIRVLRVRYNNAGALLGRGIALPAHGERTGESNYPGNDRDWNEPYEAFAADYEDSGGGGGGDPDLSDADPADIAGSAGPGVSADAARIDHVHRLTPAVLLDVLSNAGSAVSVGGQRVSSVDTATDAADAPRLDQVGDMIVAGFTAARLTPPDANTIIRWTLNESAAPFANTGAGGALDLAKYETTPGTVTGGWTGIFGDSARTATGYNFLKTADTSIGESTDISVHFWVYMLSLAGCGLLYKRAAVDASPYGDPYVALHIAVGGGPGGDSSGKWNVVASRGTPGTVIAGADVTDAGLLIPLRQWTHLAITIAAGGAVKGYINGMLGSEISLGGDVGYGGHGPWSFGGVTWSATPTRDYTASALFNDVRVENAVRSQAYFKALYRKALGLWT